MVAALAAYESAQAPVVDDDLSAAQRARHQAVQLAERMLRDVMGASGEPAAGLSTWQEAAMMRAAAEEDRALAGEEAKRLVATANAERAAIRAGHDTERRQLRADLQRELQASRDAAAAEVAEIRSKAEAEATEIVRRAADQANETKRTADAEAQRLERRLAVLHSALADAEGRFRRLAATAANEVGTMQAIIDQDVASVPPSEPTTPPVVHPQVARPVARPELYLAALDLTDEGLARAEKESASSDEPEEATPGMVTKSPDVGFYQRRLAGLRDRLEKSGHPPD